MPTDAQRATAARLLLRVDCGACGRAATITGEALLSRGIVLGRDLAPQIVHRLRCGQCGRSGASLRVTVGSLAAEQSQPRR